MLGAMSSATDDLTLFLSWRGGDRTAGAALIERHFDAVDRFFANKTDAQLADDLVQLTFTRCIEHADRWQGQAPFRAYLFGIARNVLHEALRAKVRDARHADVGESAIIDLVPGASTRLGAEDERRHLRSALLRLPVDLQTLLELCYWEDLSIDELAETFQIPPGTVKSRLHRARRLLREALESTPGSDDARETSRRLVGAWEATD
jgi:RNA polymerase sigma factor (sigma-70 family)